ncbi:glycosyltransferase [Shewanella scandinavica]|uniref:Glycosyltransferase n=1 Tax=Shewanella scandinavica TaxID=3063538 RepID=A0ABU3FUE4_9GAMM|nr:glycosyltransferase [Shewanella sp. SP2S1-2]MDT3278992.1 glycosyltransferase [Shewanella sp. SP2S1-2]
MSHNSYVILIPSLSRGGAESMAFQYGKYLSLKGHSVKFLLMEDRVDPKYQNVDYMVLGCSSLFKTIKLFGKLKFHKDVIFISLIPLYTFSFLIGNYIRLRFYFKVIYTVHNNIEMDFSGGFLLALVNKFYIWKLKSSSNVYSVSEGLNRQLNNLNINSRTLINKVSHSFSPVLRHPTKKLNFLMVGRLTEQKDYSESFNFFHMLKNNNIDFSVDIFGEGPLKESLVDEVNTLSLSHAIKFREYRADIESVFIDDKYNVFLLTSNYEGFGLVILEAISKNLFPIARDCEFGPKEIISKGVGYLLPLEFSENDVLNAISAYKLWEVKLPTEQFELTRSVFSYFSNKSEDEWSQIELYL